MCDQRNINKVSWLIYTWNSGDSLQASLQELDVLSTWLVTLPMICGMWKYLVSWGPIDSSNVNS